MTFTVKLQGVIIAVADTFEEAERIARVVGVDAQIETPSGVVMEFVMGLYRRVDERSALFLAASTMDSPEDEIERARRLVG